MQHRSSNYAGGTPPFATDKVYGPFGSFRAYGSLTIRILTCLLAQEIELQTFCISCAETEMAKVTMYPEALERYVYSKIMDFKPVKIRRIEIRRLSEPENGCNWVIAALDCDLPPHMMAYLENVVIASLRDAIDLAEERRRSA